VDRDDLVDLRRHLGVTMADVLLVLAFMVLLAILNRVRGGGFGGDRLPGHPRYYVAVAVGAASCVFLAWPDAVGVGLSYLVWSLLPWGRWADLGRLHPDHIDEIRASSGFEILVGRLPNDHVRFTARNLVGLVPAVLLIHPAFALLSLAQTAAYELGWDIAPQRSFEPQELLTGALWAAFIVVLA